MRKTSCLMTLFTVVVLSMPFMSSCSQKEEGDIEKKTSHIITIDSLPQLTEVINSSDQCLIAFDLYADWCRPCHMLSPVLEEVAKEHKENVWFYKIDVDAHPGISRMFGVRGIPYVVFVKNKKAVEAITGVRSKNAYVEAIIEHGTQKACPKSGI